MGGSDAGIRQIRIAYDPLPSQRRFHQCGYRFKGFSGPIGSGKSMALCQEAVRLSFENPGRMGLLGAPTYPMLREATMATLFEILDGNRIRYDHSKAENTLTLLDSHSRIIFRPVDEFERLRGTNLAWFGLDELTYTPEESWLRLEGRLRDPKATRQCGFAVWTPKGYDWVYKRFVTGAMEGYKAILAEPSENRFVLAKTPDFYENFKTSYDDKFYRQEILGEYLNMNGGRVYGAFERANNVQPLTANPSLPYMWALDFNYDPLSSLVVQCEQGVVKVLDEIVLPGAKTEEACAVFLKRYPKHPRGLTVYADASGRQQRSNGDPDIRIIADFFADNTTIKVKDGSPPSNPGVKERVGFTNKMLRNFAGDSNILIDPKCKELIADLEEVTFKDCTGIIDKDRDRKRTHTSDALGYLLWQECRPKLTVGHQNKGRVV